MRDTFINIIAIITLCILYIMKFVGIVGLVYLGLNHVLPIIGLKPITYPATAYFLGTVWVVSWLFTD